MGKEKYELHYPNRITHPGYLLLYQTQHQAVDTNSRDQICLFPLNILINSINPILQITSVSFSQPYLVFSIGGGESAATNAALYKSNFHKVIIKQ